MTKEVSLTWPQALAWRMKRGQLASTTTDSLPKIAERLLGVQAQVMSSAELALSLRSKSATPTQVRDALWKKRTLVKTWTVRGTLHLVTPSDLELFVAVMSMRGEYWAKPSWEKYHGIKAGDMRVILDGVEEALGDQCLTREELAATLSQVSGKPKIAKQMMGGWGSAIKPAAFRGLICFGPSSGRNVTFVNPRSWLDDWRTIDGDESLTELIRRYLDTYGPATKDEVTRWLGVEPRITRRGFATLEPELVTVDVQGTATLMTPWGAKDIIKTSAARSVRLLPAFDPYVVGVLKNLERLLSDPENKKRVSRTAGWISPTIVVDGKIIGVWKHEKKPRSVSIETELFDKVDRKTTALITEQVESMRSLLVAVPDEDISVGDQA